MIDDLAPALGHLGNQQHITHIAVPGAGPDLRKHGALDIHRGHRGQAFPPDRRAARLDDPGVGGGVAAEHAQRLADLVHGDVVTAIVFHIAGPADHHEGQTIDRRRRPGAQDIADHRHLADLERDSPPLLRREIVVDGARARIVDQIVDDDPVHPALEQGAALIVVGVKIAHDQQAGDIVVDQRPL